MQTPKPSLRDEAIEMYVNRPAYIKVVEVAEAIDKTPEWLRRFGKGDIKDPGVTTVESLIAYILKRKGE